MDRRRLLESVGALAGVLAGCSGFGSGGTPRPTPEAESLDGTTAGSGTETADARTTDSGSRDGTDTEGQRPTTTSEPQIDYNIELTSLAPCGTSCRTATFTVQNHGRKPAPDTVIDVQITTGGESVYDETVAVGDIGARSQLTDIKRDVDVGLGGANKIRSNGGDVTVEMTPKSGDYVGEVFTFERTLET